jgi:hypothetical protein
MTGRVGAAGGSFKTGIPLVNLAGFHTGIHPVRLRSMDFESLRDGTRADIEGPWDAGESPASGGHDYQLAFFTPGIRPRLARFRKQIRQMPNLR